MARQNQQHEHAAEGEPGHKKAYRYEELTGILGVFAAAACVLGYIMSLDPRGRHGAIIAFLVAWFLFGLVIAALYWQPKKSDEPVSTLAATPSKSRFSEKKDKFAIKFGGDTAELSAGQKTVLFQANGLDLLSGEIIDGKLVVNAQLFDAQIRLIGNELSGRPPTWDSNFDDTALEIVNENGQPMFQLEYLNDQLAVVNGFFVGRGRCFFAHDDVIDGVPASPEIFQQNRLEPIFKYPSARFREQRVKP
jgi:hypothetical protein